MDAPELLADDSWLGVTAFVPEGAGYTSADLAGRLREALAGCVVGTSRHGVEISGDGWRLWLYESRAAPADRDWAEYAEMFAGHPRSAAMAAPGWRLEFASRGAEAGEDGGPAVATAAAVVASFPGAFVFDGEAEHEL